MCSSDLPTSANQEDHVSMAAHGARRLMDMAQNLSAILAIEWLCAAQGVELRAPIKTSTALKSAIKALRAEVEPLGDDRYLAGDIEVATELLKQGALITAVGKEMFSHD